MFEETGTMNKPFPPLMNAEFFLIAKRHPTSRCLGYRPYDAVTKSFGKYQWLTYGDVQKRRANFGAGIVQVCKEAGVLDQKHGVGLWCQNRPEWQITGQKQHALL